MDICRSMIITNNEVKHFHRCPGNKCNVNPDGEPEEFYSEQHAIDNDWIHTKDTTYCMPRQLSVWVCPDCIAGHH